VKFLVEGEEEIGSPGLQQFCHDHKELLEADVILVSDTTMIALDTPSITVGLRGLTYLEVQVTGPNKDLHSGLFGGAVPNPANILVRMLTSIIDENQRIVIPGFYDDVQQVPGHERNELNRAPFDLAAYTRELDIPDVHGEEGYTTIERTGIRPSFDINGMWSGYTAEGAKTVLPSTAHAKISFRLVPNQDHRKIGKLVARYLDEVAPPSVKVETKVLHGGQAYVAPVSSSAYRAAEKAMEMSLGKKPVPVRSGGSIPIIATFDEVLSTKAILMGFGLESDVIHSPNENFPLENFYKGIEAITRFHENFNG
jgi:acetylornithine deacetylase/succinyl-diaminopimelate desuccinylase-like protein